MLEETPPEYQHDTGTNDGDISISFLNAYQSSNNTNNLRIPITRQNFDFHNNIQDVYLVSGAHTPVVEGLLYNSNSSNDLNGLKTPVISKSSDVNNNNNDGNHTSGTSAQSQLHYQQLFDTPYLNQLYAEYVPHHNNSNINNSMSMSINQNTHHHHNHHDDEIPSLSDISLLNFRSDTPLGSFKTPNKGYRHNQVIGASTLKKISGLISTPLKSGPTISGKLLSDDEVDACNEKRISDDSDSDSNDGRNSPCVKHQFHLNNSSYTNSTTSHIFTQNSFKGDITTDSTGNSTNNHSNNKNFQLFNDFSPMVTRKLIKPLSRSTTMPSHMTPIKSHDIKFKTPESANSTSSTIVLNSSSRQTQAIVNQSGLDLSPTPTNKRFLVVPNNTSTPDKNMNLPSMGNFGPPLLGTFKQRSSPSHIKPILNQNKKKLKLKSNSGSSGGQQFHFIMTDMKKFTQGNKAKRRSTSSSSILKDSTNTLKRKKVSNKEQK